MRDKIIGFIILITVLFLGVLLICWLSEKDNLKCEEIAKLDYNMKKPSCNMNVHKLCCCYEQECTKNSCKLSGESEVFNLR